jgi:ZIP family zinc transporter
MAAGAGLVALVSHVAHRRVAAGVAPVIGVALVLHDLPEGFAVGAVVGGAGLAVALPVVVAVAAHNLPEKLAFVAPAAEEGRATVPVLAAATLPEPVGAALAGVGAAAAPGVLGITVAVAGGMMLAVAVGTLPTLARRARAVGPFLTAGAAGATSMAVLGLVLPA